MKRIFWSAWGYNKRNLSAAVLYKSNYTQRLTKSKCWNSRVKRSLHPPKWSSEAICIVILIFFNYSLNCFAGPRYFLPNRRSLKRWRANRTLFMWISMMSTKQMIIIQMTTLSGATLLWPKELGNSKKRTMRPHQKCLIWKKSGKGWVAVTALAPLEAAGTRTNWLVIQNLLFNFKLILFLVLL